MDKSDSHEAAKRLLAELKDAGLDIAPAANGNLSVSGKDSAFARNKERISTNKAAILAYFASRQPGAAPAASSARDEEEVYIPHSKQFCRQDCPHLQDLDGAKWCSIPTPRGGYTYLLTSLRCCPMAEVPNFCAWFHCAWYEPERHYCCWRSEDGKNWVNANVDGLKFCPEHNLFAQSPPPEAVTQ